MDEYTSPLNEGCAQRTMDIIEAVHLSPRTTLKVRVRIIKEMYVCIRMYVKIMDKIEDLRKNYVKK